MSIAKGGLRRAASETKWRMARTREGRWLRISVMPTNGDFLVIGDDVNACSAHLRAAHAEESYVHAFLESSGQARGIHIPGSFACGDEERNRWHARSGRRSICRGLRSGQRATMLVRELAGGVASVFRQAEFLLLVLELVEAVVNAALGEQFLMRALFAQSAFVEDENASRRAEWCSGGAR